LNLTRQSKAKPQAKQEQR